MCRSDGGATIPNANLVPLVQGRTPAPAHLFPVTIAFYSMNPDLEKLIQLQKTDSELRRVEAALDELPRRQAELEAALAEERRRVDHAKESLAQSQKARRQGESELQDLESKRSKYKGQLMEVKTNKEYTAMLHEIEAVEREIKAREDQILQEMEASETLTGELQTAETLFKGAQQRHKAEMESLVQQRRGQESELGRLQTARDQVAGAIEPEALALYARVAKLRGAAVAEAKDEMCLLCHVKLRPQMYVDLKHNETIVQCPSCSRILYFEPSPPVVAHQP